MSGLKVAYVSAGWLELKNEEGRNCVCCILCDCDFVASCTTDKLMCGWIQLVSTSSYKQIQCYECSLGNFENPKFSARYLDLSGLYISFKFPRTIPFCVCVFVSCHLVLLSWYLHAHLTDDLEPFYHTYCFAITVPDLCVCGQVPFPLKQIFSDAEIADFEFFLKKFKLPAH